MSFFNSQCLENKPGYFFSGIFLEIEERKYCQIKTKKYEAEQFFVNRIIVFRKPING